MSLNTLSALEISQRLSAAWTGKLAYADSQQSEHCAAVLVPIFRWQDAWHLLLTRRAETLAQHSGQVAFPGGGCEIGDNGAAETALREAEEEIGLQPQDVQPLGILDASITITHYHVTPVVGQIPWPYAFRMQTSEVARIFSIPLSWLADPAHYFDLLHPGSGRRIITYQPFNGDVLWGASARITHQLIQILQRK